MAFARVVLFRLLCLTFINCFISEIRSEKSGCSINSSFLGIIMYADDLLLLSASVSGLQQMLNCCDTVSSSLE